ncbi:MAG: formate dehydrogenase accessory sulfurtransferase FdhD [Methanobacteriota archaeon]
MVQPTASRDITRVIAGRRSSAHDLLVVEEPLEIRVNGESVVVTMRTPGNDEELALGFLHNEAILAPGGVAPPVRSLRDDVYVPHGNVVDVEVPPERLSHKPGGRTFLATSACGVCGQKSIRNIRFHFAPVASALRVDGATLATLPGKMREAQEVFAATGGLHAAALFDPAGGLLVLREDVGRHNAVDKVVGWALREARLPLASCILQVSGRAGFEILQKAVAAGIPVVSAVGAPSALAVEVAESAGVTLAGFVKENAYNLYSHPERVTP